MIVFETRVDFGRQFTNIRQELNKAMLRVVIGLQRYIILEKLSGNVLHILSGNLARSITYSVEENGDEIIGTVGVGRQAPYGKAHELGGDFNIPSHNRRSVLGNVFTVRDYIMHLPQRSFIRTSFAENDQTVRAQLQAAIAEGANQ